MVGPVLCTLQGIAAGQFETMLLVEVIVHVGSDVNTCCSHPCEVHHAPNKHIERYGNNLVFHIGDKAINGEGCLETSVVSALPGDPGKNTGAGSPSRVVALLSQNENNTVH